MTESIQDIISQNIRYYRKKNKMTQAQLAKKIHKTVEMVCQLENKMSSTKLSTLKDIADVLGLEVYQLCLPHNYIDYRLYSPELKKTVLELQNQREEFLDAAIDLMGYFKTK